jgi:serine/threonine protein kinase
VLHRCPACQRSFDEPGFCPYDRTQLVAAAGADAQTMLSAAMPTAHAQATDLELRKGTFPLTPTPPSSARTQEVTAARTRVAPDSASEQPEFRAVSAHDDSQAAFEAFKAGRVSEYDGLVGQTLDGRYHVIKKIGEGGMGVVFSARHAVIERPLAIKVLKREVMRDTATIKRFVQEAKAASRIGHPNIVDVTDFGTTPDGMTYSVMEFVTGQTLGAAMRASAPFHFGRAIRIAAQIARALGAAHDKGIVHRDLKPENVFLIDRDGRTDFVKIVDFGIAKVMPTGGHDPNAPRLTRAGSVFGTPEYMAPEQAAGRSDTDGRVDIYALGVILYEMITGRVPHRGDTMVRTLAMQMLDPVEPPSKVRPDLDISPEVEGLVLHALAKKREQRFQTMGELLGALEQLQTPVGVSMTGSPVYALAPLPPGADPTPQPDTVPPPQVVTPLTEREESRSKSPTNRRLKDEPEFVASREKPVTFEHVFTDEIAVQRGRRWPLLLLFALIAGGAIGAIALVIKSRTRATEVAAPSLPDASVIAVADGQVVVPVVLDGGEALDATDIVVLENDAGVRTLRRDGGDVPLPNTRGVQIQVLTRPEGARLYAGTTYRGVGGTTIEELRGSKIEITCKEQGYKPGVVQLVFDGRNDVVLCILERIKICIDNIKNPFDDCEVDPNKPMPGP